MKWFANRIMDRRARRLLARIRTHLPLVGTVADVGSGTGHNGQAIRTTTSLTVHEFDVADLHWVGDGPVIFEEPRLPAEDDSFDALLMLFVLQYVQSPASLLSEVRRLTRGPVIVLQSTYRGWWGRTVLSVREFAWGRLALRLAAVIRLVSAKNDSLRPRQFFTRTALRQLFATTGFEVRTLECAKWPGLNVSRDLFVLGPVDYS